MVSFTYTSSSQISHICHLLQLLICLTCRKWGHSLACQSSWRYQDAYLITFKVLIILKGEREEKTLPRKLKCHRVNKSERRPKRPGTNIFISFLKLSWDLKRKHLAFDTLQQFCIKAFFLGALQNASQHLSFPGALWGLFITLMH